MIRVVTYQWRLTRPSFFRLCWYMNGRNIVPIVMFQIQLFWDALIIFSICGSFSCCIRFVNARDLNKVSLFCRFYLSIAIFQTNLLQHFDQDNLSMYGHNKTHICLIVCSSLQVRVIELLSQSMKIYLHHPVGCSAHLYQCTIHRCSLFITWI